MKGQGPKCGVCWHKSQLTYYNFFYRKTRTKIWYVLAQITVNIL